MAERVVDRVWQGVGDWLVEWYLHQPNFMFVASLILWLALFALVFWYFVLVPANANLIANGSFETELVFWGTGWVEDTPNARDEARVYRFVRASIDGEKAQAYWHSDPVEHRPGGHFSLKVEHSSGKRDHLWSTLAQRIRVKERTTYELTLWAKTEKMDGDGDLWVSPNGSSVFWDQPKIAIRDARGEWTPYRITFNSGDRVDLDIRFVAEGRLAVWVDDVVVRRVPDGDSLVTKVTWWVRRVKTLIVGGGREARNPA